MPSHTQKQNGQYVPTLVTPGLTCLRTWMTRKSYSQAGMCFIPIGVTFEIPDGMFGMVANRSSMASKGLVVAGGIIDSGYRDEVSVVLWNVSLNHISINPGDKIAQIIFMSHFRYGLQEALLEELSKTSRGKNGFGSTGR